MLRPWRCIAALLVCHLVSCAWETTQNQEHTSTAEDLVSWLRASGGVVRAQPVIASFMHLGLCDPAELAAMLRRRIWK